MTRTTQERTRRVPEAPFRPYPSKLYVETTTRCNLACPMCVKQTWGKDAAEGLFSPALFARLGPAMSPLEALVLNGIGEPLLHPHLETFIETAKSVMPGHGWVGFQSNGLLLDRGRARSLVASGLDRICLSVDAVDPAVYRSVRSGGEVAQIEEAFRALEAAKKSSRSPLSTGVEFVVMRDNLQELPRVLRWAVERGAGFAIVTHLLPYHEAMLPQILFDANTDAAVALFLQWKEKAVAAGLDIYRYTSIYLKYGKTPEEWKIFDLVEAMKAEAFAEGVFLHLESLFSRGDIRARQVQAIFDEARAVAQETGLDLKLPEAIPRSERTCEFVEEGGAFISWDGNVHPCYFLWHQYRCYIDGHEKFVEPKAFGNLENQSLLDIWNSPEYELFRRNVTGYDYPFCFNCGFALCDSVQVGDFQQDCYVNTEPCGACLWCMGVFNCLR